MGQRRGSLPWGRLLALPMKRQISVNHTARRKVSAREQAGVEPAGALGEEELAAALSEQQRAGFEPRSCGNPPFRVLFRSLRTPGS